MREVTPLYVVDIRNEWKHLPAFVDIKTFSSFLLDNRNSRYIKFPSNNQLCKPGQFRFTFSTHKELMYLFEYMKNFRNCTIVIDEADALFADRKFEQALKDVFLGSRNNNITMIFLGKRPFLIPILVRSQADKFTVFLTEEKRDVDYLGTRVNKEFPKEPNKLKRGEAIIIEQGKEPYLYQFDKFKGD